MSIIPSNPLLWSSRDGQERHFYTGSTQQLQYVILLDNVNLMQFPLRYAIYDLLRQEKSATEDDLLEELNKNGNKYSPNELNKALMQLEILGLVTVRWVGKDKRRIEVVEIPAEEKQPRVPS